MLFWNLYIMQYLPGWSGSRGRTVHCATRKQKAVSACFQVKNKHKKFQLAMFYCIVYIMLKFINFILDSVCHTEKHFYVIYLFEFQIYYKVYSIRHTMWYNLICNVNLDIRFEFRFCFFDSLTESYKTEVPQKLYSLS